MEDEKIAVYTGKVVEREVRNKHWRDCDGV